MKIVVTGATGFVGRPLVRRLLAAGHEVRALSRNPEAAQQVLPVRCRCFAWDPGTATIDARALAGADVVVHLAGESVAGGRWTMARKGAIRDSRVAGTRNLVSAIQAMGARDRPAAFISASAIGVYGDRGDASLDEAALPGEGFLAEVCVDWEREVFAATQSGLRVVAIRVGVVLGKGGGALAKMLPPFRLGGGGRLGSGRQWMSWIHLDDLVGLFMMAVERTDVAGVINGVAPEPVTNGDFTRALGTVLRRPTILPAPAFALKLGLGEMAAILLASQRVQARGRTAPGLCVRISNSHRGVDGSLPRARHRARVRAMGAPTAAGDLSVLLGRAQPREDHPLVHAFQRTGRVDTGAARGHDSRLSTAGPRHADAVAKRHRIVEPASGFRRSAGARPVRPLASHARVRVLERRDDPP